MSTTVNRTRVLVCLALALAAARAQETRKTPLTLDEVLLEAPRFDPKLPRQLMWHPDSERVCHVIDDKLGQVFVARKPGGSDEPVVTAAELLAAAGVPAKEGQAPRMPGLKFSEDGRALLFSLPKKDARGADVIQRWRFDLATKTARALHAVPAGASAVAWAGESAVAYVSNFNISAVLPDGMTTQVTHDGYADVHYGVSVHRDEFGIHDGMWWDPTRRRFAFYKEDLRAIAKYPYADATPVPAVPVHGRYPMAGATHSVVQIGVFDIIEEKLIWLETDTAADWWLTNVTFGPSGEDIYVARVNRAQNQMDLVRYSAITGKEEKVLFTEKDDQWIEPEEGPIFLPDRADRFLWFSPRDGYRHLYLYSRDGDLIRQVTTGKTDIQSFVGFATKPGLFASGKPAHTGIFVTASSEDAKTLHVYHAYLPDDAEPVMEPLTKRPRGRLSVIQSPDKQRFLSIYQDAETPPAVSVDAPFTGATQVIHQAPNPLAGKIMGSQRFFTLDSPKGDKLHGHMILPPDFDETKKYPALCYVYGGSHVQLVTDSWLAGANLWLHWLATQGFVVYRVDNHGTPNRGIEFAQATHRQLGTVEIEDQLAALTWIKTQPFIDPERIGVTGWSYGGFTTASLMCRAPGAFKCGIAGAPVTDWALYETGYGERYMDTPAENRKGYADSNVANHVKNLTGKLLVIHGTADDTVVMQHTLRLLDRAVQDGVDIECFIYPGQKHGIAGKSKVHLYRKMSKWLKENL